MRDWIVIAMTFVVGVFGLALIYHELQNDSPAVVRPSAGKTEAAAPVRPVREPAPRVIAFREFLNALMQVESGGDARAVGDGGASKGLYQIGKLYWIDGCGVAGDYETAVWDKAACERVMWNYWTRYCPDALQNLDYETLARIHNGGPRGATKQATIPYWNKVKQYLEHPDPA